MQHSEGHRVQVSATAQLVVPRGSRGLKLRGHLPPLSYRAHVTFLLSVMLEPGPQRELGRC